MNNAEIEMILQELLKELQAIKQTSKLPKEENSSKISRQLEAISHEIGNINSNIKIVAQKKSSDVPKIDYAPILRFEQKLAEFKRIQSSPPPKQIVRHEHSFKNWQWLAVLLLFIGLSVLFGWLALDNYYESKDVKNKYEFVRKEMPRFIRQLDSAYQVNPDWVEKYHPILVNPSNSRLKKNTSNKHK